MFLPIVGEVEIVALCRKLARQGIDLFYIGYNAERFAVFAYANNLLFSIQPILEHKAAYLKIGKTKLFGEF